MTDALLNSLMPLDRFAMLCVYVMALTGTPGPANMALVALGGTHGVARVFPFFLGTLIGFACTFWLAAAGLLALVTGLPVLWTALKIACIAYIAWLAWLIARTQPLAAAQEAGATPPRVPGFLRGFWVHPLNPKAYAMQVAAISQFTVPERYLSDAVVISLTFMFLGGAMNMCWAVAGRFLARLVNTPWLFRAINITLAVLMVASTVISLLAG